MHRRARNPCRNPARTKCPTRWRQPIAPFQLADHTWYIGTESISAVLVIDAATARC